MPNALWLANCDGHGRRPGASPAASPHSRPLVHEPDVSAYFAPLFALLEVAIAQRDYESPAIADAVDQGAAAARAAGVPPERVLSELRARLHSAPLIAVGEWYRSVLVDRLVLRAIQAYYDLDAGQGGPRLQ